MRWLRARLARPVSRHVQDTAPPTGPAHPAPRWAVLWGQTSRQCSRHGERRLAISAVEAHSPCGCRSTTRGASVRHPRAPRHGRRHPLLAHWVLTVWHTWCAAQGHGAGVASSRPASALCGPLPWPVLHPPPSPAAACGGGPTVAAEGAGAAGAGPLASLSPGPGPHGAEAGAAWGFGAAWGPGRAGMRGRVAGFIGRQPSLPWAEGAGGYSCAAMSLSIDEPANSRLFVVAGRSTSVSREPCRASMMPPRPPERPPRPARRPSSSAACSSSSGACSSSSTCGKKVCADACGWGC